MRNDELTETITSNFVHPRVKVAPSPDYEPQPPFHVVTGDFHALGVKTEKEALDMFVDYGYEVHEGTIASMCDKHGVMCIAYNAAVPTTEWFGIRSTLTLFAAHPLVNPLAAEMAIDAALPGMT